jgi:hypothetical protein
MSPSPCPSKLKFLLSLVVVGSPSSSGLASPDMTPRGITTPSSRPTWRSWNRPTAAWKEGVIRFFTLKVRASPPTLFSNESVLPPQVVTRPNEKSLGPRICEALRVMNPFESMAGRKV